MADPRIKDDAHRRMTGAAANLFGNKLDVLRRS